MTTWLIKTHIIRFLFFRQIIAIESYADVFSSDIDYSFKEVLPLLPFHFLSRLFKSRKYNFTPILTLVKKNFPDSHISENDLVAIYQMFYIQRYIYRFLLNRWKIKKVFLTQNGIQKALICACSELNIPIIEFQHGIVDRGHLAYSYPRKNIENIYVPNKIMSLSDFWFRDCILPKTEIVPIGNDYFNINENVSAGKTGKILVISADVFGEELASFIQQCMDEPFFKSYIFYFKLHPNQFNEYDYYKSLFEQYENVIVMRNEKDVPTLLNETEVLFTIQSTAVYEGLQRGVKICILKRSSYMRHEHIFMLPNVFLADATVDLKYCISKENLSVSAPVFFQPFDRKLFEIKINGKIS